MNAAGLRDLDSDSRQARRNEELLGHLLTDRPLEGYVRVTKTCWATKNDKRVGTGSAQLGTVHDSSRFSQFHEGKSISSGFKILYAALDLATACYETMVRNRFDFEPMRELEPEDYEDRCAVTLSTRDGQTLALLDLTGGNATRSGVSTDVIRSSDHEHGQHFSEFVHRQMPYVDGFMYASRFTDVVCVGVYWRAVGKLISGVAPVALTRPILDDVMHPWNITVS